jgi:hypothetical protein
MMGTEHELRPRRRVRSYLHLVRRCDYDKLAAATASFRRGREVRCNG